MNIQQKEKIGMVRMVEEIRSFMDSMGIRHCVPEYSELRHIKLTLENKWKWLQE